MRKKFIQNLVKKNKTKKNIYLIINDLGYNVVEPFEKEFPKNFYNAGISEQNMMSMSAGLASEGAQVFVYSIGNFSTFRCAEQIRNDVDYHKLPVTIVSVGSGLSYGNLGYTHHALQDYSLIRSFPDMLILSPGNNNELLAIIDYITKKPTPSYLRLDKNESSVKSETIKNIKPGQIIKLHAGNEKKIILTTGSVQEIASEINFQNYSIYSLPIWGKNTKKTTSNYLKKFDEIITIEDHFEDGGFGTWVYESIKNCKKKIKLQNKYISEKVLSDVGSKDYLMKKYGPKGK